MPAQRTKGAGADHAVMRGLNRSLVLDTIKADSPISRAAIAKSTSLAKPTVSVIVEDLLRSGLIREIGVGGTTVDGGRPPVLLEFDSRSQFVVGTHIGVSRTTVVVADALGVEVHRTVIDTATGDAAAFLGRVAEEIRTSVAAADAAARTVAVGVCIPGLTDVATGVCLLAPNLGWRDVPVRELLSSALDLPVYVHNTTQAAAVAENLEGAGHGAAELVLLYLGTGIGSGILSAGRLVHGAGGLAGELGHCHVPWATEPCTCGRVGCLETVASGRALVTAASRAVASGVRTTLTGSPSVEEIVAAAKAGDTYARELVTGAGAALGMAASWLINLVNPTVLVLAGGLVQAGPPLLDPLRRAVAAHALPQSEHQVEIRLAELGGDAEVRGAVLLAMQYSESYYRVVFQGT